ncbi:MAG: helix-turn-helix domain-containing protein [Phycisphaerales bacterium]|nr:helix-turn-helix domain-containing protein [Phycisphaerales bacterium]
MVRNKYTTGAVTVKSESPDSPGPLLVDTRGAAKLLSVSARTVADWRARHGLPYIKIGQLVRFDPAALSAWVQQRGQGVQHVS